LVVEDARGARFPVHEFKCRRLLGWASRFELDSGEEAARVDGKTFSVVGTGERLELVEPSQADGPA